MRIMRITAISLLLVFVVVVGCSSCSNNPGANSQLVSQKLHSVQVYEQQARQRNTYGSYVSATIRPETGRDSGRKQTLMFLKNINFRIFDNIGYKTENMIVSAHAKDPSQPVIMDDPQSFDLKVLGGKVIVPPEALTELMVEHVFNFPDAPLRKLRFVTKTNLLAMSGEMNRHGRWVPFLMEGTLLRVDEGTLAFKPTNTLIEGKSANALLTAANIDLDEVLTVHAPGVVLTKSTIYLKLGDMFPPPKLTLTIKTVKVTPAGIVLEGTSKNIPAFPKPLVKSDSYIIVRGGDVKFLNLMPLNGELQILSDKPNTQLDFSLYDYREQLAAGHLKFRPDGCVLVYMKNYSDLKLKEMAQ